MVGSPDKNRTAIQKRIFRIFFINTQVGWGQSATSAYGGGSPPGNIWRTLDGVLTWELQSSPTIIYGGFYFTDENHGWAVSNYGTILHYNNEGPSGILSNENSDQKFKLKNYPNPFNSNTTIEFSIIEKGFVFLSVYDISGKLHETIISEKLKTGIHKIIWNAESLQAGIYFLRLETNGISEIRKLVLMD